MAIIESVEDTIDDVKKVVGKNGLLILGVGVIALFTISYLMQNKSENEKIVVASGIASYPDSVTNADVIIGTLEESISYAEKEIQESIETVRNENADMYEDMKEHITTESNATNDYIKDGFNEQMEYMESMNKSIDDGLSLLHGDMSMGFKNLERTVADAHLATALQMESTEMNIRKDIHEKTVKEKKATKKAKGK
jgi:hypothetical protein